MRWLRDQFKVAIAVVRVVGYRSLFGYRRDREARSARSVKLLVLEREIIQRERFAAERARFRRQMRHTL